jgi:hypothetical protein
MWHHAAKYRPPKMPLKRGLKIKILRDIWLITHTENTIMVSYLGKLNQIGQKKPHTKITKYLATFPYLDNPLN